MANVIRHKRGTSNPSASDFSSTAELLVNTTDGGLFTLNDSNSVVEIGSGGGGGSSSTAAYVGVGAYFETGTPSSANSWLTISSSQISSPYLDTNSFYNSSNGRYEIPAGVTKVRLRVNVLGDSGTGTPANAWRAKKNGVQVNSNAGGFFVEVETGSGYGNMGTSGVSDAISVSEGDYFQLSYSVSTTTRSYAGSWQLEVIEGSLLGATEIADNVVDEANLKVSNAPTNGYFLQAQSGNTGGLTWAEVTGGGGGGSSGPDSVIMGMIF